jgi:hypothetical protein
MLLGLLLLGLFLLLLLLLLFLWLGDGLELGKLMSDFGVFHMGGHWDGVLAWSFVLLLVNLLRSVESIVLFGGLVDNFTPVTVLLEVTVETSVLIML